MNAARTLQTPDIHISIYLLLLFSWIKRLIILLGSVLSPICPEENKPAEEEAGGEEGRGGEGDMGGGS